MAGRLQELGVPAFGINVGETGTMDNPEKFVRRRDELWWAGRLWFHARDTRIPNDPGLISELSTPTYREMPNGKVLVESKDELKKRGVKSPNKADAFNLTFAGGEFAGLNASRTHADDGGYDPLDLDRQWRNRGGQMPAYAISDHDAI
jgi:hypothetical protein